MEEILDYLSFLWKFTEKSDNLIRFLTIKGDEGHEA